MALQTITTIKIGEIIIKNFTKLEIVQKIHDHHTFSVEVRKDLLVDEFKSFMPVSQRLSSEKISIEIKAIPDLDDLMVVANPDDYKMQFYGVVTAISSQLSTVTNMEEIIVIKGYSTSVILDNGPESNSFTRMSLEDIVKKVKSGYEIDLHVTPYYKDILAYTVQYNESDFNFLNRIAKRHGQWFYYNGRVLVFGGPGTAGGEPKLVYAVNMKDFRYDIKLMPTLFKVIENDNREGDYTTEETINYRNELDGFHQNFINKSNGLFNKETVIQLNQNAVGGTGRYTVEEYAKNKMRSAMSGMLQIEASSEVPGITLGNVVQISGVDMQLESRYTVTEITHTCDDGGDYENHFTAVNYNGSVFSPQTNPDLVPRAESQTAIVIDTNDPDGLSAIKVQMPWQQIKGETTPFIPMLQQHGGDARGSHIIPEIGDTVFVDFQGQNAEMPIVKGTLTSRKEKSGYSTPNNDLKVMRTRSGIIIILNDADGSVLIEDPSGNKYFMDGKGSIKLLAPKNIELEAGEDIIMKAGKNIECNANIDIIQTADRDINISAFGNINEGGNNKTETITDNYIRTSAESTQFAEKVDITSTTENMLLESSQNTVEINSAEQSNIF